MGDGIVTRFTGSNFVPDIHINVKIRAIENVDRVGARHGHEPAGSRGCGCAGGRCDVKHDQQHIPIGNPRRSRAGRIRAARIGRRTIAAMGSSSKSLCGDEQTYEKRQNAPHLQRLSNRQLHSDQARRGS